MDFNIADLLGKTKAEARPYQQRIVQRCMESYLPKSAGGKELRSVMIESPTGSGKTIMALLAAKALQAHFNNDLEIGWVSMRRNLLAQAEKENIQKAIGARISFISMFEKNLPAKLLNELPDGSTNPERAPRRMLIVDEAQHDAANSMASIHAKVKPEYIMGMTATPFRTDHVKLCFDTVLKDAGLATLIKDGYLSPYHHYTIPDWSVRKVIGHYLADPQKWGKSIFYFHTLIQCEQAARLVRAKGIDVEVVTGSSDRDAQIERFQSGKCTVLINCMVLTEGFDCPDLKTVFCRPSCKGVTIQMCGRAFRKHQNVPYKQIVQAQKGWPFIKLALPQAQYTWEKIDKNSTTNNEMGWLSLMVNPHINALNCKMLIALAGINTTMPDYCQKQQFSTRGRARRRRNGT